MAMGSSPSDPVSSPVTLPGFRIAVMEDYSSRHDAPVEARKVFAHDNGFRLPQGRARSFTWGSEFSSVSSSEQPQRSRGHSKPREDLNSTISSNRDSLGLHSRLNSTNTSISTPFTDITPANGRELFKSQVIPQDIRRPQTHAARRIRAGSDPAARYSVGSSIPSDTAEVPVTQASRQPTTKAPRMGNDPISHSQTTAAFHGPLPALQARAKRLMTRQKLVITCALISLNFIFIFASWWWPKYYYLYLPFISFPLVLNCIMIASIIFFALRNLIRPENKIIPEAPENMLLLMPCYNETYEECTKSLDSLVAQAGIDDHKKAIMIICDGRVRGPGMEKTTAQYLNDDILQDCSHREIVRNAYVAWDSNMMDVELTSGTYKGVPYFCIVKQQNQGKRDSLIVVRSFLYNFNIRKMRPRVIFSPHFFKTLSTWLTDATGMDRVDFLIGMDADTVFDPTCISELVKESRYPHTVGVCGYVAVDFKTTPFNPWSVYQSTEYTIAQGLRRLHQSVATHKVSCLPGCCQLLRICETTCGDLILLEKFGYHPQPLDGIIKQIRATASEDRNHVCLMLTTFPKAQTRQALHARAYTDVPHSWSVFLSQRRRWTLGATGNDLLLVTARGTQWWERIIAFANVLTWFLNVFVIASIGCMVYAFLHQPYWIILAFAGPMIIPLLYYIGITVWIPRNRVERLQYLAGLVIFTIGGPFINIAVLIFALYNMDSFGWGKTRKVVADDASSSTGDSEKAAVGSIMPEEDEKQAQRNIADDEENQLGPSKTLTRARFTCPA